MADKLTAKQRLFVEEYLVDLNASEAARRCGYSEKTAHSIGQENLKKPAIANEIQKMMDKRSEKTEVTAEWVLRQIKESLQRSVVKCDEKNVLKATELLGKHLKLFTDRQEVEHTGEIRIVLEGDAKEWGK